MGWEIEVHHINVNQGDSTLIIVKEKKADGTIENHKAILIDGGTSAVGLWRVYSYLKSKLKKEGDIDKYHKLNGIVVTHYDADHVGGIASLLGNKNFKKDFLDQTFLYDQGTLDDHKSSYSIKLMRMGKEASNTYAMPPDSLPPILKVPVPKIIRTSVAMELDPKKTTSRTRGQPEPKDCSATLLGHELLWKSPETPVRDSKGSLEVAVPAILAIPKVYGTPLIEIKNLRLSMLETDRDKPALFCVAINQTVLGDRNPALKSRREPLMVIPPGTIVTPTNKKSIALLLIAANNQLLHYLAGDMDEETEERIVRWISANQPALGIPSHTAVKISHHGSDYSTPIPGIPPQIGLLETLQPQYAIISTGANGHGHPSLTTLFYFHLLRKFKFIPEWGTNRSSAPIFAATNCPNYLRDNDSLWKVIQGKTDSPEAEASPLQKLMQLANALQTATTLSDSQKEKIKAECDTIKSKLINPKTNDDILKYFRTMWANMTIKAGMYFFSVYTRKKPEEDAICLEFSAERDVSFLLVKDVLPSPPSPKRPRSEDGGDVREAQKPRTRAVMLNTARFSNDKHLIIASSQAVTGTYDIQLTKDCELDKFVQVLPANQLALTAASRTDQSNIITVSGTLDGPLAEWMATLGFSAITVTFHGQLVSNTCTVARQDVVWAVQVDQKRLPSQSPTLPVTLDGTLKSDNTVVFDKLHGTGPISTNLLDNLKFTGYITGDGSSFSDVLKGFLNNALIFPLTDSSSLESESKENNPLPHKRTRLILNPQIMLVDENLVHTVQYQANVELVSQIQLSQQLVVIPNILTFDSIFFTCIGRNQLFLDNTWFWQESSCYFDATAKFGNNIRLQTRVGLNKDGNGTFTVNFDPPTVNAVLPPALSTLATAVGMDDISQSLKDMKLEINPIKSATISFSLKPPKIISCAIHSEFKLKTLNNMEFDLTTCIFLPDGMIQGDFTAKSAMEEMKEEKARMRLNPPDSGGDENDSDNSVSTVSCQDLMSAHGLSLPGTQKDQNLLGGFYLANVYFSATPKEKYYTFSADLTTTDGQSGSWSFNNEIKLESLGMSFTCQGGSSSSVSATLSGSVQLGNAQLWAEGTYAKGGSNPSAWGFEVTVSSINMNDLMNMLPLPDGSELSAFFSQLILSDLKLTLVLGDARTFSMSSDVNIGDLVFTASYDSSKETKIFVLAWDGSEDSETLSMTELFQFLKIPDFSIIDDINFTLTKATFQYEFTKSKESQLSATLTASQGEALFIHFKGEGTSVKNLLAVNVNFPTHFDGLPVVGSIPSPLTQMQLLVASAAITAEELRLLSSPTPFPFPLPVGPVAKGAFLSFMLAGDAKSVSIPLSNSSSGPSELALNEAKSEMVSSLAGSPTIASPSHWFKMEKTLGPLTVQRLGFSYASAQLTILFDASLTLGPVTMQAAGLGATFNLTKLEEPIFSLDGLGLGYASGPLALSGSFLNDTKQLTDKEKESIDLRYSGGASFHLENLTIAAIGSYAKFQPGVGQDCSVFVFARANYPFGGPAFFFVTGFAGGFGYNQSLRVPTQDEVVNFPLVQGSVNPLVASGNLLEVEKALFTPTDSTNNLTTPWLTAAPGQDWLAIGLDFTTFEIVGTRALAVVEFGQDFQLAILGRSSMQLPMAMSTSTAGETIKAIVYVEMGLEAVFKLSEGYLGMTALLSPNSYVLTPACHLTGGFAFSAWLTGEHAGDFAVTLGGYHPSFKAPAWYPQVPRLGFNWQVDDAISIEGDTYFALTSSAMMLGGHLQASYHSGRAQAWFKAGTDFLIEWHPFHYEAEIGISVGASYCVIPGWTSSTISVEVGANLQLWGPPTGGNVYVDLTVISFSIPFGFPPNTTPDTSWENFKKFLPAPGKSSQEAHFHESGRELLSTATGDQPVSQLNHLIVTKGLLKELGEGASKRWIVRADEFQFYTEAVIPVTAITLSGTSITDGNPPATIYIKPMKIERPIAHTQTIVLTGPPIDLSNWHYDINRRAMPRALWGTQDTDPLDASLLPDCWTGLTLQAPANPGPPGTEPIDLKVFAEEIVKTALLPLNQPTSTLPSVNENPESSSAVLDKIAKTIATNAAQQQRGQLVTHFQKLGLFKQPFVLSKMTGMASQASNVLLAPPLISSSAPTPMLRE